MSKSEKKENVREQNYPTTSRRENEEINSVETKRISEKEPEIKETNSTQISQFLDMKDKEEHNFSQKRKREESANQEDNYSLDLESKKRKVIDNENQPVSSTDPNLNNSNTNYQNSNKEENNEESGKFITTKPKRLYPNIKPNRTLGVFGLSSRTSEKEINDFFSQFAKVIDVTLIYDRETGYSRGYGFIIFEDVETATKVKEETSGKIVGGRKIRVDYSRTETAHQPTPGRYAGKNKPLGYRRRRNNERINSQRFYNRQPYDPYDPYGRFPQGYEDPNYYDNAQFDNRGFDYDYYGPPINYQNRRYDISPQQAYYPPQVYYPPPHGYLPQHYPNYQTDYTSSTNVNRTSVSPTRNSTTQENSNKEFDQNPQTDYY